MSIIDEWLILCKAQVEGSGFNKLNKQIQTTKNNLFDAKNLFRAFIGYDIYSGIKAFGTSLVQSTKDLGAMTSRFYAVTKSEKLANEELQWTFDLAQRTAMGLKSTADSYSIFYAATQRGLGTEGARQVFQDWTEVSRVLHLSEYQFERVTYALREMASKGAIYSQDLRMQIGTHVPNAIGLAEKAVNDLGISGNNWFEDFQKQAKGNQKLINQFIVLFSKYAKEAYASPEALAKAMELPDAQIKALQVTWEKFLFSLADGNLFAKDLVQVLKLANTLLSGLLNNAHLIYNIVKAIIVLFLGFNIAKGLMFLLKSIQSLRLQMALLKMDIITTKKATGGFIAMFRLGIKALKADIVAMEAVATFGLSLIIDLILEMILNWDKWVSRFRNWKWLRNFHTFLLNVRDTVYDILEAISKIPGLKWVNPYGNPENNQGQSTPNNTSSIWTPSSMAELQGMANGGSVKSNGDVISNVKINNRIEINGSNMSQADLEQAVTSALDDSMNRYNLQQQQYLKNTLKK